jgi:hypothetical protein
MSLGKFLTRPLVATIAFYILCGIVSYGMHTLAARINADTSYPTVPADGPDAFAKAVDAYQVVNNLLTTLATGLLAGLGFLLFNLPRQKNSGQAFWWAALSGLCACVSLYWGYISSQNVEAAIEGESLTLDLPSLQYPRQLEAASMMVGVILAGHFVMRTLINMNTTRSAKNVSTS